MFEVLQVCHMPLTALARTGTVHAADTAPVAASSLRLLTDDTNTVRDLLAVPEERLWFPAIAAISVAAALLQGLQRMRRRQRGAPQHRRLGMHMTTLRYCWRGKAA